MNRYIFKKAISHNRGILRDASQGLAIEAATPLEAARAGLVQLAKEGWTLGRSPKDECVVFPNSRGGGEYPTFFRVDSLVPKRVDAILSRKYKIEGSRLWFVDVVCGACESDRPQVLLSGWIAPLVCRYCGAEMHKPKKKRGRPLGSGTERKVRGIRFSDEEWATVGRLADRAGLNRSDYLRSLTPSSATRRALSEIVDALEAYADDWNSKTPTDPTVLLPMLRDALKST